MKNIKNFLGAFVALLLISCCTIALPSCQTHTDSKKVATFSTAIKSSQVKENKPATPVKFVPGSKQYSNNMLRLNTLQCLSCHNSMPEYNLCLNKQSLTLSPMGDPWYSQSEIGSMLPYYSGQLSFSIDAVNRYKYSSGEIYYSQNAHMGRAGSEGSYSDLLCNPDWQKPQ